MARVAKQQATTAVNTKGNQIIHTSIATRGTSRRKAFVSCVRGIGFLDQVPRRLELQCFYSLTPHTGSAAEALSRQRRQITADSKCQGRMSRRTPLARSAPLGGWPSLPDWQETQLPAIASLVRRRRLGASLK